MVENIRLICVSRAEWGRFSLARRTATASKSFQDVPGMGRERGRERVESLRKDDCAGSENEEVIIWMHE